MIAWADDRGVSCILVNILLPMTPSNGHKPALEEFPVKISFMLAR